MLKYVRNIKMLEYFMAFLFWQLWKGSWTRYVVWRIFEQLWSVCETIYCNGFHQLGRKVPVRTKASCKNVTFYTIKTNFLILLLFLTVQGPTVNVPWQLRKSNLFCEFIIVCFRPRDIKIIETLVSIASVLLQLSNALEGMFRVFAIYWKLTRHTAGPFRCKACEGGQIFFRFIEQKAKRKLAHLSRKDFETFLSSTSSPDHDRFVGLTC